METLPETGKDIKYDLTALRNEPAKLENGTRTHHIMTQTKTGIA